MEERLISLKEAATEFRVSHSHLRLLARTGKIAATRMGRDWFTTRDAVAAYLKDHASEPRRGRRPQQ